MVFQDVRRSLLPWMNAERNITFPLRIAGFSSAQVRDKLERVIEFVGAPFDLKARVFSLSGGEAQLVCLLRALIIEPRILLCDEPLSALDYQASIVLQDRLLSAAGRLGLTVIYVCHDLDEALYLGDRVVFLSARPARVMHVLETGLGRPRSLAIQATPEFALLKGRALRLFAECTGNRFNGASGSDLKSP
jgi:NitT/TauT family transport system ATP-binding protein